MEHDIRPWGQFWVIENADKYKIKRIEVNPGGKLSYQYHQHRAEVWVVITGIAFVTLEGISEEYVAGETVVIPQGSKHRVENRSDETLVIIEVQTGSYFGEDDIIRLSDDYNRK